MMEKQKVMSQTTKQDKTTEKQLNELKIDNLPGKKKKKIQNDSNDEPGSQEHIGQDVRNVYQRPIRTKG